MAPEPVRSVKTEIVTTIAPTQERAFPAVLEPPQITPLAFEVGGRLGPVDLQIGQRIEAGAVLMRVEPEDFDLRLQQAEASLTEVESGLRDARADADRQTQLFDRGVGARAARDTALARVEQAEARVEQAQRNVELVKASRADTALRAPFDGVVNSIDVRSFQSVQPGVPAVTLYRDDGLQARILVSYRVVSQLSLGQQVKVAPSDGPERQLAGTITEIARRAPSVASFPVVVSLDDTAPDLRSGMAVEVLIELPVGDGRTGQVLPVTALATHLIEDLAPNANGIRAVAILVYDTSNSTVVRRDIAVGGISGSEIVVIDGLIDGERVVTAGVTHLRPGQEVTLWRLEETITPNPTVPNIDEATPSGPSVESDTVAAVDPMTTRSIEPNGSDAAVTLTTVPVLPVSIEIDGPEGAERGSDGRASVPTVAVTNDDADAGAGKEDGAVATSTPRACPATPFATTAAESRTVRAMQAALNDRGFDAGPVDGVMGARTRAALQAFQRREGIAPTGEPCVAVLTALDVEPPGDTVRTANATIPAAAPTQGAE